MQLAIFHTKVAKGVSLALDESSERNESSEFFDRYWTVFTALSACPLLGDTLSTVAVEFNF